MTKEYDVPSSQADGPSALSCKNLLAVIAVAAVAVLLFVASFNILVDAKGLYLLVRAKGFNENKVFQPLFTGQYKAVAARRYRPDTVIFGASTVLIGVVAECKAPRMPGVSRLYNYAGAGTNASFLIENLPDLLATGSIKRLAVETRFFEHKFSAVQSMTAENATSGTSPAAEPSMADALTERLRPYLPMNYAGTYIRNLIGWEDVLLSVRTVALNRTTVKTPVSTTRGYEEDGTNDLQWGPIWQPWMLTEQTATDHNAYYIGRFLPGLSNDLTPDLSYLDRIVSIAARNGVAVDLFIPPEHMTELLLYSEAGIWALFEKFKMNLLQTVQDLRTRHSVDIRFFDFGNVSAPTTQPLRQINDRTIYDPYYIDPVHFRRPVGEYMLATMFQCEIPAAVPEGFAIELAAGNIAAHFASQRQKLREYRRQNSALVERMSRAIETRLGRAIADKGLE
jgi:hypothetical protein